MSQYKYTNTYHLTISIKYFEIIEFRLSFNFMYFFGWAIHEFKIPTK